MAKFKGTDFFRVRGDINWLEMHFCTVDSFYNVKVDGSVYKRSDGNWIGAGTLVISVDNSDEVTFSLAVHPAPPTIEQPLL